jgi:outer membrane protein TolC
MAGQVELRFIDPALTTGNWTMTGIREINTKVLTNPGVDLVITMGVLASQEVSLRNRIQKPVIAGIVLNHELQNIPYRNGSSGILNLTYIQLKPSLENELTELKKVVPFRTLSIVIDRNYYDVLNPEHRPVIHYDTIGDVTLNLVFADTLASGVLQSIPGGVDAVYLDALFRMSDKEFRNLIDSLADRKLPTFGYDETVVDEGALASVNPRVIGRLSRRIALDIQQILLGQNASTLPVELLAGNGFYLNFGTFLKLGLKVISWDLFTEATFVDLMRVDSATQFISLPDLMTVALDSNRDLVARKYEVMAGSKNINIARAALLPYLNLNATGTLNDSKNYQPPQIVTAGADLSQSIYSEPNWSNYRVEQNRQGAREEGLNSDKLDIGNQVAQAYLDILEYRNNFYILINNLLITRSNLEVSRMKKETGSAGEDEILRWQIEVAKSKKNVISAFSSISQVAYRLVQLIHVKNLTSYDLAEFKLEKSGLLIADSSFFRILDDPIQLTILGDFLVGEGISNSPTLRQYDFLITAQERLSKSANISRFIPTASAFGNYTNRMYQAPVEIQPGIPVSYAPYSWYAGAKLEIPLFTGLKNNAVMQQSRLSLAQLKNERLSFSEKLEVSIRSSLSALMSSYYDYRQMMLAETAAGKNLTIVNNQYLLGKKSILDVLDAQQQNLNASMSVNTSFYGFLKNYFSLQKALGKFDYMMSLQEKSLFKMKLDAFMKAK